jgi:hypothetical protein
MPKEKNLLLGIGKDFKQRWMRSLSALDVWVRVRKPLKLPEHLVPVCDGLEKGSLTESMAVKKLPCHLATIMPCLFVHVGQCQLIGTT